MQHLSFIFSMLAPHLGAEATGSGPGSSLAVFVSIVVLVFIAILAILVLLIVARWKIFIKAGKKGWESIVPFYNQIVLIEIVNKPYWWVILLYFVPIVNIVIWIIILRRLAATFGRGAGFTIGLILLPFIFYPILAFGKSVYVNTYPPAEPMSEKVKWALIVAGIFMVVGGMFFALGFMAGLKDTAPSEPLTSYADSGYATDGTYVYYSDKPIDGLDPDTFTVKDYYGMDATSVYYGDVLVKGANPATFEVIESSYSKDAFHVYSDGKVIENADPATFEVIDGGYARDATQVFYYGSLVKGADADSFETSSDYNNSKYDASDKNYEYYSGKKVR